MLIILGRPFLNTAGAVIDCNKGNVTFHVNVNDDVHVDAQPSNDNDVEIEPFVDLDNPQSKNQRYDKRDFVSRKHSKEREPWVQKPMPFPPKPSKSKDDEDFEHFAEMI